MVAYLRGRCLKSYDFSSQYLDRSEFCELIMLDYDVDRFFNPGWQSHATSDI
jgi:hypothetical protein